jgi:hypothetical protein
MRRLVGVVVTNLSMLNFSVSLLKVADFSGLVNVIAANTNVAPVLMTVATGSFVVDVIHNGRLKIENIFADRIISSAVG